MIPPETSHLSYKNDGSWLSIREQEKLEENSVPMLRERVEYVLQVKSESKFTWKFMHPLEPVTFGLLTIFVIVKVPSFVPEYLSVWVISVEASSYA